MLKIFNSHEFSPVIVLICLVFAIYHPPKRIIMRGLTSITSPLLENSFTPLIMPNDEIAIKAAIKTCNIENYENVRIVRINNTLEVEIIEISENMLNDVKDIDELEVLGDPYEYAFDDEGNIVGGKIINGNG